jgi:hypothetical protein
VAEPDLQRRLLCETPFFLSKSLLGRGEMDQRRYYFSTRDLLMMAALAALGGVVSTYVNAIGDLFQWQNGVVALGGRVDGMSYNEYSLPVITI